jgi:hypothetical protein
MPGRGPVGRGRARWLRGRPPLPQPTALSRRFAAVSGRHTGRALSASGARGGGRRFCPRSRISLRRRTRISRRRSVAAFAAWGPSTPSTTRRRAGGPLVGRSGPTLVRRRGAKRATAGPARGFARRPGRGSERGDGLPPCPPRLHVHRPALGFRRTVGLAPERDNGGDREYDDRGCPRQGSGGTGSREVGSSGPHRNALDPFAARAGIRVIDRHQPPRR